MRVLKSIARLTMLCGLLVTADAGAAVVYKWKDANGLIHYSDQPVPGAEKIVTASGAANGIGGPVRGSTATAPRAEKSGGKLDYAKIAIEMPAAEQVFFGEELVPVRLHLEPALKPKQSIAWLLNGVQLKDQGPESTTFSLQGLPRGAYQLLATVSDSETGEAQSSESVTFYVRQPSELSPLHKKP